MKNFYHAPRLLIIDDNVSIHEDIRKSLDLGRDNTLLDLTKAILVEQQDIQKPEIAPIPFVIDSAYQSDEAVDMVRQSLKTYQPYALAFVDVRMPPGLDGMNTIKKIWKLDPDIQIVICTAYSDYSWDQMNKQLGNKDNYLILKKPFEAIEVRQLAFSLSRKWQLYQQSRIQMNNLESLLKNRSEELKKSEQALLEQTTHDQLTGLPNRDLFVDYAKKTLAEIKSSDECYVGVFCVAINDFQSIKNNYGFQLSDLIIKNIGKKLLKWLDKSAMMVARLDGDTFSMLVKFNRDKNNIIHFTSKLLEVIKPPVEIKNNKVTLSYSIGISIFPLHSTDAMYLLEGAYAALNVAKSLDPNSYKIFDKKFIQKVQKKLQVSNNLRQAIKQKKFTPLYYPIYDLLTNKFLSMSTRLAWKQFEYSYVFLETMMPVIEEIGEVTSMSEWSISTICYQLNTWIKAEIAPGRVAIPIQYKFFRNKNFVTAIEKIINTTNTPATMIEFELTELTVSKLPKSEKRKFVELTNLGFQFVLTDVDMAYINLNLLGQLPFKKIRISKKMIKNIHENKENFAILQTIGNLAKTMHLEVIVDGIETSAELEFLKTHASDIINAYILNKELDVPSCKEFLLRQDEGVC